MQGLSGVYADKEAVNSCLVCVGLAAIQVGRSLFAADNFIYNHPLDATIALMLSPCSMLEYLIDLTFLAFAGRVFCNPPL